MVIRKLLPEDAPAFQAIRLRGLQEIPFAFSSSHAEEVDTPVAVIAQRLTPKSDGAVLGAFQAGNLVGLTGIQREGQRQFAHKAIVWGMYVVPEHRRNGTGRLLLLQALEIAANDFGVRSISLGVNTQNKAAIALYESVGFRTYGTEVGFLVISGQLYDQHLMRLVVGAA